MGSRIQSRLMECGGSREKSRRSHAQSKNRKMTTTPSAAGRKLQHHRSLASPRSWYSPARTFLYRRTSSQPSGGHPTISNCSRNGRSTTRSWYSHAQDYSQQRIGTKQTPRPSSGPTRREDCLRKNTPDAKARRCTHGVGQKRPHRSQGRVREREGRNS